MCGDMKVVPHTQYELEKAIRRHFERSAGEARREHAALLHKYAKVLCWITKRGLRAELERDLT